MIGPTKLLPPLPECKLNSTSYPLFKIDQKMTGSAALAWITLQRKLACEFV